MRCKRLVDALPSLAIISKHCWNNSSLLESIPSKEISFSSSSLVISSINSGNPCFFCYWLCRLRKIGPAWITGWVSGSVFECLVILWSVWYKRLIVYTMKINNPQGDQGLRAWKLGSICGNPCEMFGTKVDCVRLE